MFSVDGQPGNWNFFANSFTNHIGAASGAAVKALAAKFAIETGYIQEVGLSDWAQHGQTGDLVEHPVLPFSLRFEPHPDVKDLFPAKLPGTDPMAYVSQLMSIKGNANLYKVYAMDK